MPGTRIPGTVPTGTSQTNGSSWRGSISTSHVQEDPDLDARTRPAPDLQLVIGRGLHAEAPGCLLQRDRLDLDDEVLIGRRDHVDLREPDGLGLVQTDELVQERDKHARLVGGRHLHRSARAGSRYRDPHDLGERPRGVLKRLGRRRGPRADPKVSRVLEHLVPGNSGHEARSSRSGYAVRRRTLAPSDGLSLFSTRPEVVEIWGGLPEWKSS